MVTLEKKRAPAGGQSGFTLLEVVVAVVILGMAYVAVLQNFSFSLKNILRVEESQRQTLDASLAFEEMLRPADEEAGERKDPPTGPVFLEGHQYNLVVVTSKDGQFATLKLVRPVTAPSSSTPNPLAAHHE
ncbi:MAG: type II secretion system protein [Desulfobacteraceae bacterium]|nr:type II secretion system protein [Desulfobacteraceae bacterium]